MERIIIHLDLDYFFAQVEENERPEYRKRPVVVCVYSGRTSESGVVSTANYEAREYGVKSGIPIKEAIARLKGADAVFLPVNHALYSKISLGVMEVLAKYGEKFEYASIDEGILEISAASRGNYENAKAIAETIKREIFEKFHLSCSLGVGPNKLVAKIASDFRKPDGLTVIRPGEVAQFLNAMEVRKIPGVGKKTGEFLGQMGIRTIGQLRKAEAGMIVETFGKKTCGWLMNAARGIDKSEVGGAEEQRQISRIATLKRNTRNVDEIMGAMRGLIKDISDTLRENDLAFSVIGVNAIDENLKIYARAKTLPHPNEGANEIRKIARELFSRLMEETKANFRRAGVRVEKLESKKGQKTLGQFG